MESRIRVIFVLESEILSFETWNTGQTIEIQKPISTEKGSGIHSVESRI